MKTIIYILIAVTLTSCELFKKQNPQSNSQTPAQVQNNVGALQNSGAIPDTVVLTITRRQEQLLNEITIQANQLEAQRKIILDLILDDNKKTMIDIQGKQIKTETRKD